VVGGNFRPVPGVDPINEVSNCSSSLSGFCPFVSGTFSGLTVVVVSLVTVVFVLQDIQLVSGILE